MNYELAVEAKEYLEKFGSQNKAAEALGIARSTFQNRIKRASQYGLMGYEPVLPGFKIKQTSTQYDEFGNLKNEWIQQHVDSGEVFEMPEGQELKGISAWVDEDGRVRGKWIKTQEGKFNVKSFSDELEEAVENIKGRSIPVKAPQYITNELLTVYPLADLHLGMLSWGRESGEDWDLNIAYKAAVDSFAELLLMSKPTEHAIILNLGDFFHSNDQKNMTPRSGNILDVDSRYEKIVSTGVRLMIELTNMALQRHEKVTVRNLKGNHDPESSFALTIALSAYYHNNSRVIIDDNPTEFFFHRFGTTLIGANHGHRLKPVDMALKLAVERADDWGKSRYRYFYFGHIHHETLKEVGGVRVESFQTVAAKDAHTANGGYTSGRSLVAITIHKDKGEVGRHRVNL